MKILFRKSPELKQYLREGGRSYQIYLPLFIDEKKEMRSFLEVQSQHPNLSEEQKQARAIYRNIIPWRGRFSRLGWLGIWRIAILVLLLWLVLK